MDQPAEALQGAKHVMTTPLPTVLPQSLKEFMSDNGLDEGVYDGADDIDRYIRINPRLPVDVDLELKQMLEHTPVAVPWLPSIYSLPSHVRIASCKAYQSGSIYGIDLSSAAAGAPGAKLCMISDLVSSPASDARQAGYVVGVDVSRQRLASCRNMLKKYQHKNVRLYLGDGSTMVLPCPSKTSNHKAATERTLLLRRYSEFKKTKRGKKRGAEDNESEGKVASNCEQHESAASPSPSLQSGPVPSRYCGTWAMEFFFEAGEVSGTQESEEDKGGWTWMRECKGQVNAHKGQVNAHKGQVNAYKRQDQAVERGVDSEVDVQERDDKKGDLVDARVGSEEDAGSGLQCMWCECTGVGMFDKVLVDAECTHDGSIKHVAKLGVEGLDVMRNKVFEEGRTDALQRLQRALLMNGFRHLKPGGILVYSTCSFSRRQNDEIIQWLFDTEPSARAVCIPGKAAVPCRDGDEDHVMRFIPAKSRSSGLFVARITKVALQ